MKLIKLNDKLQWYSFEQITSRVLCIISVKLERHTHYCKTATFTAVSLFAQLFYLEISTASTQKRKSASLFSYVAQESVVSSYNVLSLINCIVITVCKHQNAAIHASILFQMILKLLTDAHCFHQMI